MADIETNVYVPGIGDVKEKFYDNGDGTYSKTKGGSTSAPQQVSQPPGFTLVTNQKVDYTDEAAQSAVVNADTTHVLLRATTDSHFLMGADPTATTSNDDLDGYDPFPVLLAVTGGVTKISVVRKSISGTLRITELKR